MKALAIRKYKAPMELMELPRPEPGPGDLLVRVRAASINPVDYKIRDGGVKVLLKYDFPLILGNDLAGVVEAIGPGVTKFAVGDSIYSRHKTTKFEDVARDCDVVFDTQGGETLLRSFACVKPGGIVVTVGGKPDDKFARAWGLSTPLVWILGFMARGIHRAAREKQARYEYLFMHASGAQLAEIAALVEGGVIRTIVDKTFPLAEAADAIRYVESGRAVGKVVVRVD